MRRWWGRGRQGANIVKDFLRCGRFRAAACIVEDLFGFLDGVSRFVEVLLGSDARPGESGQCSRMQQTVAKLAGVERGGDSHGGTGLGGCPAVLAGRP
jgi:hypothetical protein